MSMEQKNSKNILPTTYEQFLAHRKKIQSKVSPMIHRLSLNLENAPSTQQKVVKKEIVETSDDGEDDMKTYQIQEKLVHSDYQSMFDDFLCNKFDTIKGRIEQEMVKLKEEKPVNLISANKIMKQLGIQSLESILKLEQEMGLPTGKRNIDAIDNMLSFNKFFVILNREKKMKIYGHAIFTIAEEDQIIYREGEIDDYMYIVVKGCIKQFQKKPTSFNEKITVNFVTHYEGSNFGESLLVSEGGGKSKRYHSTIAAEKSYLLKILNSFYRELITNSKEDDFQKKLNSLLSTAIFKDTSKLVVMPLVSTIERIELDYGRVLIRQGQPVRKLYFVASGNLQVIYLDRSKRNIKHIVEKPENFYIKKPQTQKKKREKAQSLMHSSFYYSTNKDSGKEFMYGKKEIIGEELSYNDHVLFSDLRIGDFLGGKSFLPSSELERKEREDPMFNSSLQAKLSVVSSSILTVVYALDQKKFFSLSDNLQKVIFEGILGNPYFDEHKIEAKVNGQREWKKYSQKLVEDVIKEKKQRNHSFRM